MKKKGKREKTSGIRRLYFARLVIRTLLLLGTVALFFVSEDSFAVLSGFGFFKRFSPLHIIWVIWVFDMLWQLIPVGRNIPLGSQKLFRQRFRPIKEKINYPALREHVLATTRAAYRVMLLWILLIAALGVLYFASVLKREHLFLISMLFYVCDLICVLIFCPFRLIMKNRCCTTCRIFNWDHLMMFTPMLFIGGFYAISLLVMSLSVFALWEICVFLYPERFWERTNASLKCSECTDKLCTQYCRKLRG